MCDVSTVSPSGQSILWRSAQPISTAIHAQAITRNVISMSPEARGKAVCKSAKAHAHRKRAEQAQAACNRRRKVDGGGLCSWLGSRAVRWIVEDDRCRVRRD